MDKQQNPDILNMVSKAEKDAHRQAISAMIIQPGAVGDCVLTLPLADMMKKHFSIGTVAMLGRSEYIDYFPGRTCVDIIKDIDAVDLHRLFAEHKSFELEDGDTLINFFAGFEYIISFLGKSGDDFEKNLIFTANCSNPVEITTVPLKPSDNHESHIAYFHLDTIASEQVIEIPTDSIDLKKQYIKPEKSDLEQGRQILKSANVEPNKKIALIAPGSGGRDKCWHIDNFQMLAEQLNEKNIEVVFLLGPAEIERFEPQTIRRFGAISAVLMDLSLAQVLSVISCCDCFIGNDSGITHMAAASGIETIACFGPSNTRHYCPLGPRVSIFKIEKADFNSPCPDIAAKVAAKALKPLTS